MTNKITKIELLETLIKISERMERLTDYRPNTGQEMDLHTRHLAARDLANAIVAAMERGNTTELDRWVTTY
jgi:2-phospho-L-lactate transferase/gluconeogenesis factor (CofD/UPF0052 family)